MIVALHDLSLAARFCHRIVLMHEGRVVASGTPQDVLTVEHLAAVYRIDASLPRSTACRLCCPVHCCNDARPVIRKGAQFSWGSSVGSNA